MNDTTFYPRRRSAAPPGDDVPSNQRAATWRPSMRPECRRPVPADHPDAESIRRSVSTAADMARFYQMILDGGQFDGKQIVSRAAVEQMTHVQTGDHRHRLHARQRLGTGLVRRPPTARHHEDAVPRHVRPRRRLRHARLDRPEAADDLRADGPAKRLPEQRRLRKSAAFQQLAVDALAGADQFSAVAASSACCASFSLIA